MPSYCKENGCKKYPYYNLPNETKTLYCPQHKLKGMINVKKTKKCIYEGCKTRPSYKHTYR